MSNPVSVNNGKAAGAAAYERPGHVKESDSGNKVKDADSPAAAVAKSRASLDSAIVQSTMSVALNAGNTPLALLLRSAINGINEALQPTLGKDAVQNAASQDNSPEATASRIVGMSTAFYDAYRQQNKLEDNEQSRAQFVDVIRGGFEQGFKEAQQVLAGLKVLGGDVAAGIDRTYELVMRGFDDFATVLQSQPGGPMPPVDPV